MATPNDANFTKLAIVNQFASEYGDATSPDTLALLKIWFDEALWDLTTQLGVKFINAITTAILPANSVFYILNWGQSKLISVRDLTNRVTLQERNFDDVMSDLNTGSDMGTAGISESVTGNSTDFRFEPPDDPEVRFVLIELPILIGGIETFRDGIADQYANFSLYFPEGSSVLYERTILLNRKLTADTLYRFEYFIGEGDDLPDSTEFFYPVQAIPILKEKLRILAYRHEGENDKLQIAMAELARKVQNFKETFTDRSSVQIGSESRKVLEATSPLPINNYVVTSLTSS